MRCHDQGHAFGVVDELSVLPRDRIVLTGQRFVEEAEIHCARCLRGFGARNEITPVVAGGMIRIWRWFG